MFGEKEINKIYSDFDIKLESKEPAPLLPLNQSSIDKVVDVLRLQKVVTVKNIVKHSGVASSTVVRVVSYLRDTGSVSIKTVAVGQSRYWEVTFKQYRKSAESIEQEVLKTERNKVKRIAVDEYLSGGVTFQNVSDKYGINIATIHKLVSEERGSNKRNPAHAE